MVTNTPKIMAHKSLIQLQIKQVYCFCDMFSQIQEDVRFDSRSPDQYVNQISELLAFLRFSMISEGNIVHFVENITVKKYMDYKKELLSSIVEVTQLFLLLPTIDQISRIIEILEKWKSNSQELISTL